MSKLILGAAAATGALMTGLAAVPTASFAQSNSQAEVVVFGTDPCPRATDDEIVVCRRLPESLRYRMPEAYRPTGTFQQRQSWSNKARAISNVGATGTGQCSPVGPGGHTGCLTQEIQAARQANREAAAQGTAPEQ
jgi:hypothetical protein